MSVSAWHGMAGREDATADSARAKTARRASWAGDAAQRCKRRAGTVRKQTWRVVITVAAIDDEVFQADGRGDLRMQQAAAKFSHEILWW